jgi:hypothetical protein
VDAPTPATATPGQAPPTLVPPVQLAVRCTACGHERTMLALHQKALDEALRCERCAEPNEVLGHRGGGACSCCL